MSRYRHGAWDEIRLRSESDLDCERSLSMVDEGGPCPPIFCAANAAAAGLACSAPLPNQPLSTNDFERTFGLAPGSAAPGSAT